MRTAALLAVILCLAAPARAQVGEGIAATVNDEVITTYDVRQRAALLMAFSNVDRTPEILQIAMEEALRDLIDEKLQMQEARRWGVNVDDGTVNSALQMIAEQSGGDLQTNLRELAEAGVSDTTLREQIRSEIAWDNLIQGRFQDSVRSSSDTVDEAMRELMQSLREPQYRVAEIAIPIHAASEEDAARARAEGVLEQLYQGGSFPVLARQYSAAPSAEQGGDTGYLPLSYFPPELAAVIEQLPVGNVAGPVRAPGAWYIVALIDRRDAASAEQLTLRAIFLPLGEGANDADRQAARDRLSQAANGAQGCNAADSIATRVEGAFVSDLGTVAGSALQPQVRAALTGLEPGQVSQPVLQPLGAQVLILCDRAIGGPGVPSREEIAMRMEDQRRSMLSRRYLRDLRREAVIKIR